MSYTRRCPICHADYPLDAAHRFGGTCSAECQRETAASADRFRQHARPNLSQSVLLRPAITRRHSADNQEPT